MPLNVDLLAVDVDGTLLDSNHLLPPANRAALHRAHEAGIRIVLCTGRSYPETCPILTKIGLDLDATVTAFGALLTDNRDGRTLERFVVPLDVSHQLTEWFLTRGFCVLWLNDREQTGLDGYIISGSRQHPAVDRWLAQTPCQIERVPRLTDDFLPPIRISIIDEPDVLAPVSAELQKAFDGSITHNLLRAPAYNLTIIEAFAPHVNKWHGIERLCRRWGINPAHTVAVGDDVNDLDMIRSAGLGVAMGNAHPEAKRVADRLTADNDSDGVALLIDELLASKRRTGC
ncbi:MAG: Cof-type HAD-IIB family hydrolase [Planctomycetota bacterium]